MKTPPLLLAAALIFWGWQTGLWIFAISIALILESSKFVQFRWEFSKDDIKKIANLCLVILAAFSLYLFLSEQSFYIIYTIFQWLPIISFPLIAAQVYGVNESVSVTTLFFIFNDHQTGQQSNQFKINLSYPYLAVCILAASNANNDNIYFYLGLLLLTAISLWNVRSRRFTPAFWLFLFLTAGSLGFMGQIGLHQLHEQMENQLVAWFSGMIGQEINAVQKSTSMGEIGVLKQSNNIVFRVKSKDKNNFPILLREATYNKYQSGFWVALNAHFSPVIFNKTGQSWEFSNHSENISKLQIFGTLNNGQGILRLAHGTLAINNLSETKLEKNQYGTVRIASKVNDIAYQIKFNERISLDGRPTDSDLEIPEKEKSAINQIIKQLNIQDKSPEDILPIIKDYFWNNYSYSLQLKGKKSDYTPLSTFLLATRSGHCEYFASATTLILRALGIPARYSIGYSVHEFSNLEQQYVVRSRHAHAWTMVYINDQWQPFDTTPPDWTTIENEQVSQGSKINDVWSFVWFKIAIGWKEIKNSGWLNYLWILLIPFFIIVIQKSAPSTAVRRVIKSQKPSENLQTTESIYHNTEFYLIEKRLNELGFNRQPAESLKQWLTRIKQQDTTSDMIEELSSLVELHYRYRFDPQGIKNEEREKLKSAVNSWLTKYSITKINPT
jgi:hypothetical protein